jgi:hypothetical protein
MRILVIDVGLIHLALIEVIIGSDYLTRPDVVLESEISLCELIDITDLVANCKDKNCELYHDKNICDYMMHLFKKFRLT